MDIVQRPWNKYNETPGSRTSYTQLILCFYISLSELIKIQVHFDVEHEPLQRVRANDMWLNTP